MGGDDGWREGGSRPEVPSRVKSCLKVAVGEGVDEGRVSVESGLGSVGGSVCGEIRAVLDGRDAEGFELFDTVMEKA